MKYKGFIIDMEGTVIHNGAEIPGSFDFLKKLTDNNIPFRMITNTVSKSVEQMATIFGKPSPALYEAALTQMEVEKEEVIAIGDDVLTDIKGAKEYGIISALVKTGKYKTGDEAKNAPDLLLQNLGEMKKQLL